MKIEKVNNELFLRIPLASGTFGEQEFTISITVDGSGILVEFKDNKYLLRMEEVIKEIIKKIGEENE